MPINWILGHKPQQQQLLSKRIRHRSPFAYVLLVFSYVLASKISLIYGQGCKKRNPTQIHKHEPKIRFGNLNFVILDRQLDTCGQISRQLLDRQLSIEVMGIQIFRFDFRLMLMYLCRVSFLTTLDIYKAYFRGRHRREYKENICKR